MDILRDKPWHPVPGNDGLLIEKIFDLVNKLILLPTDAEANFEANIQTNFNANI